MACECCDQLAAKLSAIEAKLAQLKPVDGEQIKREAIQAAEQAAALATAGLVTKVAFDKFKGEAASAFAGKAEFESFKGITATKPELEGLRGNWATKPEVAEAKAAADRLKVTTDNLRAKQIELDNTLGMKVDTAEMYRREAEFAKKAEIAGVETRLRAQMAETQTLAREAKNLAEVATAETKSLTSKIGNLFAKIGTEIEKAIAPFRAQLGKIQGVIDGLLGKVAGILNELGVLQPLKRLIGLVGKLLWIIDLITAFISFDTFATVKGLQVRVDGLEHNQDRINQDISDMLGRYGGLKAEVRRAEANAQKAINEAEKSAGDAASATDKASNALAKAIRAISESDAASGLASSATSEAKKAIGDATNAIGEAKNAANLALTAKNEILATQGRLTTAEVKIAGINSEVNGIHGDIQGIRNEVFGFEADASQALTISLGLLASYGVLRGGQALLSNRVSRVESELQTVKNRPGIPGKDGRNGLDGKPGKDGKNGLDGKRGLRGIPGLRGLPGINGRNGVDGKNGLDGRPGLRGLPGLNGKNGLDGKPGLPGKDGLNGRDGKDVNPAELAALNAKLDRNYTGIQTGNAQSAWIQRFLNTEIIGRLNTTLENLKNFSQSFERFAKWAHLDRVLGVINLAANLHNALMLSTNLGQSLMSLISNSLNALGLGLKDKDGHSLDLGALINGSIEALVIKVVGKDNYTQASSFIKATSAIYQAAMNGVYAISAMVDATRNIAEITGSYVGKIGNALKRSGTIFEHAFPWMNEDLNQTTATSARWEKLFSNIDNTANAAQSLDMVAGSVVSIKDSVTQLKQTREEYNTAHKQAEDALAGKATESKLESQAPVTLLDAKIGKAE
jgi:hypothetical protein